MSPGRAWSRRPRPRRAWVPFVQISAIGADPDSASAYGRSKAEGEAAVREAFPRATVLRPSTAFGPEDDFVNKFAQMARLPVLPVLRAGTRFQPVYVNDVARAIAAAALSPDRFGGRTFELGRARGDDDARAERLCRPRHRAPSGDHRAARCGGRADGEVRLPAGRADHEGSVGDARPRRRWSVPGRMGSPHSASSRLRSRRSRRSGSCVSASMAVSGERPAV